MRTLLSKFSLLRFRLFLIVNTQFGSPIMLNLRLNQLVCYAIRKLQYNQLTSLPNGGDFRNKQMNTMWVRCISGHTCNLVNSAKISLDKKKTTTTSVYITCYKFFLGRVKIAILMFFSVRDFSNNRITSIANGTFVNVRCVSGGCRLYDKGTIW